MFKSCREYFIKQKSRTALLSSHQSTVKLNFTRQGYENDVRKLLDEGVAGARGLEPLTAATEGKFTDAKRLLLRYWDEHRALKTVIVV